PPRATRTPLLDKFGRDLTQAAREGKLNAVVGRQRELEQIVHILVKDTKNNPLLVGEAGVGKTAVVEALAQHIASGQVPALLRDKRLIEITMSSLVAGTRYRGDFEERMQRLVDEVRSGSDVLIFIDEIHTLVGAGEAGGALDAANILKPALARGELHCIGATTPAEYQRSIAQDAALERRFQVVPIDEPSPDETLSILQSTRARYEARYGVQLMPEALSAAVRMSVQYLPDQRLPDKARDLVEEACARVSVGTMGQWGIADAGAARRVVDANSIAQIIAERKGLPIEQLTAGEQQRLLALDKRLKARVIGQDAAVAVVTRAVRMARTGLKDPNRPSGVFLFIGPTGVGKTELAKALAGELFGSDDALIRLDMSEFMEAHSVAKLIGAPPGYVGYREEGQLVRDLRRKPYSVVLIDEIEKAASNIFDLFLQLFDEGRLTDAQGRHVDGRHAIYIMTSNVGTELVGRQAMGFTAHVADEEALRQDLHDRLRQTFRPEFLNRIDETIVFHRLGPEHIRTIAQHHVEALQARVESEHHVRLEVTPEAIDVICTEGYSETLGARPLRRALTRLLAAPLSEMLLSGSGGKIVARAVEGRIVLERVG
ncbi:MAG TPA: ATP-dependent Clp protease ATP-binding subunit, partial [Anaerolineae bacterium]